MRILISNDDGIHARGIEILENLVRRFTDDVWIVAPELNQSCASHSLTLQDPLRIRELDSRHFAVNGTPSDCVLLSLCHLLKDHKPDFVLSGINHGDNLADDIIYSGTVAAAMEGALLNVPSFALSLCKKGDNPFEWDTVLEHGPPLLEKLFSQPWKKNSLLNINFPPAPPQNVKGLKVVSHGQRVLGDKLLQRVDPRGHPYFWIGALSPDDKGTEGDDLHAIFNGYISLTPLTFYLTDQHAISKLKNIFIA